MIRRREEKLQVLRTLLHYESNGRAAPVPVLALSVFELDQNWSEPVEIGEVQRTI